VILHAVLLSATLASVAPEVRDRWFAEDKLKHFTASFVVSSMAATGVRVAGLDRSASNAFGVGTGIMAGLLKEVHDARAGGVFSVRDLAWDFAGVGAAAVALDASR
jgi:uncharacterized protein YfiM (DUF2279 family)